MEDYGLLFAAGILIAAALTFLRQNGRSGRYSEKGRDLHNQGKLIQDYDEGQNFVDKYSK